MKFNGRFLALFFPMMNLCIRHIDGEEGAGGSPEDTGGASVAQDRFGDDVPLNDSKDTSPAAEQGASNEKGNDDEGTKGRESSEEQAPAFSEEDLLNDLSPEESSEAKAARLEREYGASSTEAKRLNAENKAYVKALESQGLKVSVKDGEVNFIPTEKYSEKSAKLSVKVEDLSAAAIEAFESGDIEQIQPEIDKLLASATQKLVRAQPTLLKEAPQLSDERKASAYAHLESEKGVFNQPKHENFAENKSLVEAFVNHPARPQALRDLFASNPELVAEMVNNTINAYKSRRTNGTKAAQAANEKKANEGRESAATGTHSEGNTREASRGATGVYNRYD